MSDPIYYGYNADDTHFDDYHRKNGLMTNREFFSSNGSGGFYEGMEWDGEEWIPIMQKDIDSKKCHRCGCSVCSCEDYDLW